MVPSQRDQINNGALAKMAALDARRKKEYVMKHSVPNSIIADVEATRLTPVILSLWFYIWSGDPHWSKDEKLRGQTAMHRTMKISDLSNRLAERLRPGTQPSSLVL